MRRPHLRLPLHITDLAPADGHERDRGGDRPPCLRDVCHRAYRAGYDCAAISKMRHAHQSCSETSPAPRGRSKAPRPSPVRALSHAPNGAVADSLVEAKTLDDLRTLFEDGDLGQAFWPWQLAPRPAARSVRPLNITNLSTGPQMALGGHHSGHDRPQKIRKPSKEPACACARLSTVVHFSPLPTGGLW